MFFQHSMNNEYDILSEHSYIQGERHESILHDNLRLDSRPHDGSNGSPHGENGSHHGDSPHDDQGYVGDPDSDSRHDTGEFLV